MLTLLYDHAPEALLYTAVGRKRLKSYLRDLAKVPNLSA